MPAREAVEVVVIGGGLIGLACAAELARRGRSVVVVERGPDVGLETSTRNSGVLHAGIYYPPGSLKARACVEGRELLYRRCSALGIAHRRIGKLIVATGADELPALDALAARADANGAGGIEPLDAAAARRREPRIRAHAALWSPNTGIVDAHALVRSFQAELERHGGHVVLHTTVDALEPRSYGWRVVTRTGDGAPFALDCGHVVNAAGLAADAVAAMAGLDVDALGWRLRPCKGDYFALAPRLGGLVRHLVYPVPRGDGGLGVHLTLDLAGRLRAGPDARYVDAVDYRVDATRRDAFAEAVRRYAPEVRPEDLTPEMAGVRPKLQGPGEPFRDFVVAETSARGAAGMVHLVGIESPGLTASPALARLAADELGGAR